VRWADETLMNFASRIVVCALLVVSIAAPAHAARKVTTPETIKEDLIVARCKADAKKYYSFVQMKKRRAFEQDCIERARR
jgi:hypothetical protein